MTQDVLLTLDEIFEVEEDISTEERASDALDDFRVFFESEASEDTTEANGYDEPDEGEDTVDPGEIPSNASLSLYFQQMGQVPLLDREEEVRLAKKIERGKAAAESLEEAAAEGELSPDEAATLQAQVREGQAARERLAEANTRLVVSVAKKYRGYGMPFLDLIQAGNVGLLRAIDRYDHKRGYKFSTYATWWIRQAVTRSLSSNKRTIRLPIHKDAYLRRIRKASSRLHQKMGRRPTYEEIAEEVGEEPRKLRRILRLTQGSISLNKPVGNENEGSDSELGSFIEDTHIPSPSETVEKEMLHDELETMLQSLPPREAWILRKRFGLNGHRKHTLKELGEKLNISKERVRQLQGKALRKLRHPSHARALKDYR